MHSEILYIWLVSSAGQTLSLLLRFLWSPIWVRGQDTASAERSWLISVRMLPYTACGESVPKLWLGKEHFWTKDSSGSRGWTMHRRICSKHHWKMDFCHHPLSFPTVVFSCLVCLSPHTPNQQNSRQRSPEPNFFYECSLSVGVKYL